MTWLLDRPKDRNISFCAGLDVWWLMSPASVTHTAYYESNSNSTLTENNYILSTCDIQLWIAKIKILHYAQHFSEVTGIITHDCNLLELTWVSLLESLKSDILFHLSLWEFSNVRKKIFWNSIVYFQVSWNVVLTCSVYSIVSPLSTACTSVSWNRMLNIY